MFVSSSAGFILFYPSGIRVHSNVPAGQLSRGFHTEFPLQRVEDTSGTDTKIFPLAWQDDFDTLPLSPPLPGKDRFGDAGMK
jgi:hypothetical protein